MKELKRLAVHVALLLAAAGFAYRQSLPEDPTSLPPEPGEVELWAHGPDALSRIVFSSDRKKVVLERKTDERGVYFRGAVEPTEEGKKAAPDAGPHGRRPVESAVFLSVKRGEELAEALAPLRATRRVGEVGSDREKSFGLDDPAGRLVVEIAGEKHAFVVGGSAPGTGDRYVRYENDDLVYVLEGGVVRKLQGGHSILAQRQQHGFKRTDVEKVTISPGEHLVEGGGTRTLVRSGTEGRRFWADADSPQKNDETAANWLSKLQSLRAAEFVEELPEGARTIVRVELFHGDDDALGFTELYRVREDTDRYFVLSETLRMPAVVSARIAAQVRSDLPTLFGQSPPEDAAGADEPEPTPEETAAPTSPGTAAPTAAPAPGAPPTGAPRSPHGPAPGPPPSPQPPAPAPKAPPGGPPGGR